MKESLPMSAKTKKIPPALGQVRYTAQICPDRRGYAQGEPGERYQTFIRRSRRVRFKRSGRVGWQWEGFVRESIPPHATRLEALRDARAFIRNLYARDAGQLSANPGA